MKNEILLVSILCFSGVSYAADQTETTETTQTTETTMAPEKSEEPSKGGLFAEPFLIYENNDVKIHTSQMPVINRDANGESNGFGVGARIGAHVKESAFVAGDIRYAKPKMGQSIYQNAQADEYNYGITAGAQTPFYGIRLWGTYVAGGQMNPEPGDQGLDLRFENLTGYRAGAGVYYKKLSVNLEYQRLTFDKTRVQSWGNATVNTAFNTDTTVNGYVLALGFPFLL
jgi:hypothetical protein